MKKDWAVFFEKQLCIPTEDRGSEFKGAKGIKLHPIIQRAPMDNQKTFDAAASRFDNLRIFP